MHYSRGDLSPLPGQFRFLRELCFRSVGERNVGDSLFLEVFGPEFASVGHRELPIDGSDRFGELLGLYAEAKYLPELLHGAGEGGTTLADGIEHACTMLRARPASQGALIVITDASRGTGVVLEKSSVPIYRVSLPDAGEASPKISGGALSARIKEKMREVQSRMLRDLRSGYRVRYIASRGAKRIEVLVNGLAAVRIAGHHEI
jgi:hypothetical protein